MALYRLVVPLALLTAIVFSAPLRAQARNAPAVVEVPLQLFIAVPSAPTVYYAPEAPLDVFQYGGRYYTWQDGWYVTERPGTPWVYVADNQVPRQVRLVPAKYYKRVPPGHAKKFDGEQRHHPHHHDHDHDGHDDD